MAALKASEKAQAEDEAAQKLVEEFNLKRMNLARDMQEGKISQEDAIKKNNEAFSEMVEKSEVIKNYVDAQNAFEELNQQVISIVAGSQGGCGGSCSSCSGCH